MQLKKEKLELIKKIAEARLTKGELNQISDKTKEILDRRKPKKE